MAFKLLFIGDVVGRPGRRVLANRLSGLCSRLDVDLVVANGDLAMAVEDHQLSQQLASQA